MPPYHFAVFTVNLIAPNMEGVFGSAKVTIHWKFDVLPQKHNKELVSTFLESRLSRDLTEKPLFVKVCSLFFCRVHFCHIYGRKSIAFHWDSNNIRGVWGFIKNKIFFHWDFNVLQVCFAKFILCLMQFLRLFYS